MPFKILGCIAAAVALSGCAATGGNVSKSPNIATWNEMHACVKQLEANAARNECIAPLKERAITGVLEKVNSNIVGYNLDIAITQATYGAKQIGCDIEGKYKAQVAALSPGDSVTVKGSINQAYTSAYFTAIMLRPCEIIESASPVKKD